MLVGYARVSALEQETALQLDALKAARVRRVYQEKLSAAKRRPQLRALLDSLRIEAAGATFRSLTEPVETTTPVGRMLIQMLGCFAEFERAVIRERC